MYSFTRSTAARSRRCVNDDGGVAGAIALAERAAARAPAAAGAARAASRRSRRCARTRGRTRASARSGRATYGVATTFSVWRRLSKISSVSVTTIAQRRQVETRPRARRQILERAHAVVGDPADRAAPEPRQARHVDGPHLAEHLGERGGRIRRRPLGGARRAAAVDVVPGHGRGAGLPSARPRAARRRRTSTRPTSRRRPPTRAGTSARPRRAPRRPRPACRRRRAARGRPGSGCRARLPRRTPRGSACT